MSLSPNLISQFAKITNDDKKQKQEKTVYGRVYIETVDGEEKKYVQLDGSNEKIPLESTVATLNNDRVIVSLKNHRAVVIGNLTTPSTTVAYVKEVETTIAKNIEADYTKTKDLTAEKIQAKDIVADEVNVAGVLKAYKADIATKVTAKDVEAEYAKIATLNSHIGNFNTLNADYGKFKEATVADLEAKKAVIEDLDADVGEIHQLIFDAGSGKTMHLDFVNALVALISDAAIKSAMIESLSANKITSGSLDTGKVSVKSTDGSLTIANNLIQIKDGNSVRIQIGKDASGKYSITICDANGATMFDVNGITKDAIKSDIIVDDMVADDANISASKLNIESLINAINENGSASIKLSKIKFDEENQTFDLVFKTLSDTVESQGTAISAVQGAITNKVWQQDIDDSVSELSTKYSEVKQDVDGITTTVADHATRISDTDVELTAVQSVIGQLTDSISMLVTDGNGTSLMTHTENGWTFSTSEIQNMIDSTSESLNDLIEQCGNTDAAVEVLTGAVADLGVMADYIKIGTYEDEPCIELGESDSNFKLMITNTRIMFMDGSDIPAYISNKSLHIKKAVIEEELHQGGFSWVSRSNGHLSLIWKGVTE